MKAYVGQSVSSRKYCAICEMPSSRAWGNTAQEAWNKLDEWLRKNHNLCLPSEPVMFTQAFNFENEGMTFYAYEYVDALKEKLFRAEQALELLDAIMPEKVKQAKEIAASFDPDNTLGGHCLQLANGIDEMRSESKEN